MSKYHQSLPRLKALELDGQPLDLNYYLTTDYADATAASVELPAIIEYLNENYQLFVENKIRAKAELERARAKAYFDLKGALWAARGYTAKMTEAAVESAIALEQDVIDATERLAIFSGWVARLHNTMDNLRAKLDMTRTSEATRRAMMEATEHEKSAEE